MLPLPYGDLELCSRDTHAMGAGVMGGRLEERVSLC